MNGSLIFSQAFTSENHESFGPRASPSFKIHYRSTVLKLANARARPRLPFEMAKAGAVAAEAEGASEAA